MQSPSAIAVIALIALYAVIALIAVVVAIRLYRARTSSSHAPSLLERVREKPPLELPDRSLPFLTGASLERVGGFTSNAMPDV